MPLAFADRGRSGPCLLATCWAHQKHGAPTLPVRVGNKDTQGVYWVWQPGRRKPTQLYHINLLKQWWSDTSPPVPAPLGLPARRDIPEVPVGDNLSPSQKQDLEEVILQHQDIFSEVPGRTTVAQHNIRMSPGITVRVPPYWVPEACRNAIQEEVTRMLQL